MKGNEFAAHGLRLADWLEGTGTIADPDPYGVFGPLVIPEVIEHAKALKARTERAQELLQVPENAAKIFPLLLPATELPDFSPFEDTVIHFERLCGLVEECLSSQQGWDDFFQANFQRILALWEEPKIRENEDQEKLLREKERIQEAFLQNLARAKANIPQPRRDAPCFATTAKNGLNCSRKTLVGILNLPALSSSAKESAVFVKRCAECWQIYKEFHEVNESTHQARSRFLKPGQSDPALGYEFSQAEADEFAKIDFASILHPVLKSEPPIPLLSFMLYDLNPLSGGRALWASEGSRAIRQFVNRYSGRGSQLWETRSRIRLSAEQLAGVEQFAAERHFFSFALEHRSGLPDESYTVIEMVAKDGRRVRHGKWANTKHPDFDAIHQLLLQLSETTGVFYYEAPIDWNWRPEGFS